MTTIPENPSARQWQPHERNYSGNRVGVWHDGGWTMLRVETSVADATISIREHEAWDLALRLSPKLKARLDELFESQRATANANHALTYRACRTELLRAIANERDCGKDCDLQGGYAHCPMIDHGECGFADADDLRELADGIDRANSDLLQAVLRAVDSCGGTFSPEEEEYGRGFNAALTLVEVALRKLLSPAIATRQDPQS